MKYRLTPENKHICIFWMPAQMPSDPDRSISRQRRRSLLDLFFSGKYDILL